MRNDSADGRTVEAHSEAFSGGAYSRWASWTQADPDPSCAGSGTVDSQHRCAMAHAAAKLSELQNCSSAFQTWCCNEILRRVLTDVANELRDEEECFIDATFVMAKGGGSVLRLDTMAAPHTRPLGIPHSDLPRLCPARLPRYPLQTILR